MSVVEEVLKKIDEFEPAMKTYLERVDPPLILDLILFKKEKRIIQYTLEVFLKTKQNTEEITNRIIYTSERERYVCACCIIMKENTIIGHSNNSLQQQSHYKEKKK